MTAWKPWLAIFLLLMLVVFAYKNGKKSSISKLIFFIFITLLPSFSILPLPRFSSPHYSFIAAPAAGVAAILIGRKVFGYFRGAGKAIFILLLTIWVSSMAVSTYTAGFQFKNDLTLFSKEVKRDNDFREGHFYLGDYYLRKGNYQQSARHLRESLKNEPKIIAFVDRSAAKINLAGAFFSLQKIDQAQELLKEVVIESSGSNRLNALYNLAVIADRKGNYQEIVKLLSKEIEQLRRPEPLLLLVKGLVKTGKGNEAEQILKMKLYISEEKKRQEILQMFRE